MDDLALFNNKLNENLEFFLKLNPVHFNLDDIENKANDNFDDLIVQLTADDSHTSNWLCKHLLDHYHEFVRRFSKDFLDRRLILLVALSYNARQSKQHINIIYHTVYHMLSKLDCFIQSKNDCLNLKRLFHLSFCYFVRIALCQLDECSQVVPIADLIFNASLNSFNFWANNFSYESAEVIGDLIKSRQVIPNLILKLNLFTY